SVRSGLRLRVAQEPTVDLVLELGEVTQEVTVQGEASMLEKRSHAMGKVIDNQKIEELPLISRDYKDLGLLVAGSLPLGRFGGLEAGTIQEGHGFFVNGLRSSFNNFLLDGGSNNNSNEGGGLITPAPETIQEFKMLTNSYSAEFNGASTIVNVVTKSGTNQFHGSLYEYFRNDVLDARGFFETEKAPLRRNQFGGTFGGPIVRDRTFFFGAYEGLRVRDGVTRRLTVPPPEWREGDFSGQNRVIRDPVSGDPFPGKIIPADRINPISHTLLDRFYPLPNDPSGFFVLQQSVSTDGDKAMIRLDQVISDSNTLYGRYIYQDSDRLDPDPFGNTFSLNATRHQTAMLSDTHVFSPSMVNQARLSYLRRHTLNSNPPIPGDSRELGFEFDVFVPGFEGVPVVNINGVTNLSQTNGQIKTDNTWQLYDVLAWDAGRHSVKVGGEYNWFQVRAVVRFRLSGIYTFNGQLSGLGFSDFLLGAPRRFDQSKFISDRSFWGKGAGFFIQDDWRMHPRFTLNLGMRYDVVLPPVDKNFGMLVSFWEGEQSSVFPDAPTGLLYSGDPQLPKGMIQTDTNNIAPRIGFAWQAADRWTLRSGYGLFFDTKVFANYQTQLGIAPPFEIRRTIEFPNSFADPVAGVDDPFDLPPGQRFPTLLPAVRTLDRHNETPYAQQWNLNLQYEPFKDYLFEIGYVGTKGTHLMRFNQINDAVPSPEGTRGNIQQRRPYARFRNILNFQGSSSSSYHGLQVSANKRFSDGFTFLSSYTFSKAIDDAIGANIAGDPQFPQNSRDLRAERALSSSHIPQRWVNSFIWRLPFLADQSGLVGQVFGGWQLNGIVAFQSGYFSTVQEAQDIALVGRGGQRPNLVSDPNDAPRTPEQWFNSDAFERLDPVEDVGKFGNAGRNVVQNPGDIHTDISLFKHFRVTEDSRLQFRAEFFNIFNHRNLNNPVLNLDSPNFGKITGAGAGRRVQLALKLLF
ncbi:MAG: hypothetical protein ACRD1R_08030, partial [Acidobacteriota bacterium]